VPKKEAAPVILYHPILWILIYPILSPKFQFNQPRDANEASEKELDRQQEYEF